MKVKVGGDAGPAADAIRAVELFCQSSVQGGTSMRLDANQAWSMADALCFTAALVAGVQGDNGGVGAEGGYVSGGVNSSGRGVERTQVIRVLINEYGKVVIVVVSERFFKSVLQ